MTGVSQISPEVAARLEPIRAQIALGKSFSQIARAIGCTDGQVEGAIHRWLRPEWAARPNPRPPALPSRWPDPPQIEAPVVVVVAAPAPLPLWLTLPIPPARACQWPATPWRRPWPLCGAAVDRTGPYCCDHKRIAYAGTARRVAA